MSTYAMALVTAALVAVAVLAWPQWQARPAAIGPTSTGAATRRALAWVAFGPSTRTTIALAVGAGMVLAAPGAERLVEGIAWLAAHTGLDAKAWAPASADLVFVTAVAVGVADVTVLGLYRGSRPARVPPRWTVPALRHIVIGLVLPTVWVAGMPLLAQTTADAVAVVGQVPEPAACASAVIDGTVAGYGPDRLANAQIIVQVGRELGVPERGQWIALATAMQESSLRNLDHGDRDSLGLFQQRPSQGWGSPAQVRDPAYAAARFYARLLDIPGWEDLPLWQAAQAVQRSGFPTAYAKHEDAAAAVLGAINATTCGKG